MLIITANVLALTNIVAESSEGGGVYFLLVPFLIGAAFYGAKYKKYRNTDKNFQYEQETSVEVLNLQKSDQFVKENKKLKDSKIYGINSNNHRDRIDEHSLQRSLKSNGNKFMGIDVGNNMGSILRGVIPDE